MNITSITSIIKALFRKVRGPAPQIPPMLMALGGPQRPGLSTVVSVGNIVKAMNKHGIPTGPAEDGDENKSLVVIIAIVEEIYRALHQDANTQIAIPPGAINVFTSGKNIGGPMISRGSNINYANGTAIIQ